MLELFGRLRRTNQPARAAPDRIALLADGRAVAFGTNCRKFIRFGRFIAFARVNIFDFWYDVARTVDLNHVADADIAALADRGALAVEALYVILVVQGCIGHDDAADGHRLQPRDGAERAGPAHLNVDGLQPGPGQFGRKLVRNRPTGCCRAKAQTVLIAKVIDLVDDPVDVIAKRAAPAFDIAVMRQKRVGAAQVRGKRIGLKPQRRKTPDGVHLPLGQRLGQRAPGIGEEFQRA